MCLTIPARVIKINKDRATVQDKSGAKEVSTTLISNPKVGDWILYVGDFALKKIHQKDAKDIINLLESTKRIDKSHLSYRFQKIIEKSKIKDLNREDIAYLLNTEDQEKEALFSEANTVRRDNLKDFICIHGIIEFSNYCRNDCRYCGLRRDNSKLKRYRMSVNEIVKIAKRAVNERGYKLLVLQSGDDYFYTDDMLIKIVRKIKESCRAFIFMSVGERGRECYEKMKEAGASGALFRFETSNPKLFKKLHPKGLSSEASAKGGKDLENRIGHLKFMRKLGYFIATGSIIGLPGQTIENLVDDILMMKKWANMISMGPFVPAKNTPLEKTQITNNKLQTNSNLQILNSKQWAEMNLKMIAVLRFLMPEVRIPVVTALETLLGEDGRKQALQAGANSLMFNLTPAKYRPLYKIYPNKFFKKEEMWEKYGLFKHEESYKMLEERMAREINRKTN